MTSPLQIYDYGRGVPVTVGSQLTTGVAITSRDWMIQPSCRRPFFTTAISTQITPLTSCRSPNTSTINPFSSVSMYCPPGVLRMYAPPPVAALTLA